MICSELQDLKSLFSRVKTQQDITPDNFDFLLNVNVKGAILISLLKENFFKRLAQQDSYHDGSGTIDLKCPISLHGVGPGLLGS